jgi:hypothetical protein
MWNTIQRDRRRDCAFLERDGAVVNGSRLVLRKASRVYYFYHYLARERLTIFSNLCHKRQYDQD